MGWVTKVTEYSKAKVINAKMSVTMMTTNARTRTSISSALRRALLLDRSLSRISFNFFLQDRGYKILGASLRKLAGGVLTLFVFEVRRVLAMVAVAVFTRRQTTQDQQGQGEFFHVSFPSLPNGRLAPSLL